MNQTSIDRARRADTGLIAATHGSGWYALMAPYFAHDVPVYPAAAVNALDGKLNERRAPLPASPGACSSALVPAVSPSVPYVPLSSVHGPSPDSNPSISGPESSTLTPPSAGPLSTEPSRDESASATASFDPPPSTGASGSEPLSATPSRAAPPDSAIASRATPLSVDASRGRPLSAPLSARPLASSARASPVA